MSAPRAFRHTGPSFADLVPYAAPVANGVILLKDGSLMACWYFAGPNSESSTEAERNKVARQINAVLSRLGSPPRWNKIHALRCASPTMVMSMEIGRAVKEGPAESLMQDSAMTRAYLGN